MSFDISIAGAAEQARAGERPWRSELELALADLRDGLARWELWGTLGWHDIRQRYRRSIIGPFWITLSMGIMVLGLSILWATLFRQTVPNYLPFFALGFIVWTLISSMVLDGCAAFYTSEGIIKQIPVPLSIHIYRMVWRNLLIAAHNLVIYVVILLAMQIWPGFGLVVGLIGFLVLAINGTAIGMIVGILSARYRDIPPIVGNFLQLVFFFSPILWMPESLPERHYLVVLNPVYYLIEIVRKPLLGGMPDLTTWLIVGIITLVTSTLSLALFVRFRRRIAYWV